MNLSFLVSKWSFEHEYYSFSHLCYQYQFLFSSEYRGERKKERKGSMTVWNWLEVNFTLSMKSSWIHGLVSTVNLLYSSSKRIPLYSLGQNVKLPGLTFPDLVWLSVVKYIPSWYFDLQTYILRTIKIDLGSEKRVLGLNSFFFFFSYKVYHWARNHVFPMI